MPPMRRSQLQADQVDLDMLASVLDADPDDERAQEHARQWLIDAGLLKAPST